MEASDRKFRQDVIQEIVDGCTGVPLEEFMNILERAAIHGVRTTLPDISDETLPVLVRPKL